MHALCLTIAPPQHSSPQEDVPTFKEAREVCSIVESESKVPKRGGQPFLTYEGYVSARKRARYLFGPKFDFCFRPRLFLRATAGQKGKLPVAILCAYVHGYVAQEQHAYQLKKLVQGRSGYISVEQAEMYIASLDLFERQGMTPEMGRIGNRMGALKAAFYHSSRGGRIKLSDFVTGRTMEEIIEVQRALEMEDLESIPANSWFSSQKVKLIHDTFCELDFNRSGVLLPEQLLAHKDTKLTRIFVDRLYEEHGCIRNGASVLDWDRFVTFVIAWSDRDCPQAIKYLFPVFDIQKQGFISGMDIFAFVRSTVREWIAFEPAAYTPTIMEDIVNEVFDCIHPATPGRLSTRDLLAEKNSGMLFGILADAYELWRHEHKEDQ